MNGTFQRDLEYLINQHSEENASNTPDFILAGYLRDCLEAWNRATQEREKWYGRAPVLVEPQPPPPQGVEGPSLTSAIEITIQAHELE